MWISKLINDSRHIQYANEKKNLFCSHFTKKCWKMKKNQMGSFFCKKNKKKKKFTYPFIINFPVLTSIRCSWSICGRQSCWCRVVIVFIVTVRWRYRTCRIICSIRNLKMDSAIISFKVVTSKGVFLGIFFKMCFLRSCDDGFLPPTTLGLLTTWCLRNKSIALYTSIGIFFLISGTPCLMQIFMLDN